MYIIYILRRKACIESKAYFLHFKSSKEYDIHVLYQNMFLKLEPPKYEIKSHILCAIKQNFIRAVDSI